MEPVSIALSSLFSLILTPTLPEKDSRHDKEGFKGLWKRVKPFDKPDEVSQNLPLACPDITGYLT